YLARSKEGTLFFTNAGVTIAVPHLGSFRMQFENGTAAPQIAAQDPLISRSNYLDPAHGKSISHVENFSVLQYAQVYPGIDVRFYGHDRHLEHEFQLAAGASASQISLRLEGIDRVRIANDGTVELTLGRATLRQSAPVP